jgi:hypothetical protein
MGAVACVTAGGVCSRGAAADRNAQGARERAVLVPVLPVPAKRWTAKAWSAKAWTAKTWTGKTWTGKAWTVAALTGSVRR